jgi:hypothetical protein
LLALGLALRCYHYLRNPSMWHDEAALVLNVLGKTFAGLLGPLYFSEAAPPLFLWIEKACAGLLGDGTLAMRLIPFLAGCGGLIILAVMARRLLPPAGAACVVLLAGCSDRLLWHCCEAKPYAVDVLVASGLLWAVYGRANWSLTRQLLVYTCLAPVLIFLSYPACFLLGGLVVCLLPGVFRAGRPAAWLWFGAFLAAAAGAFWLLWAGPIQAQRDERLLDCWKDVFPDWHRPWIVPGWAAVRLVEVVRYACEPTGDVLSILAGIGAISLWRAGHRRVTAFCLVPVALAGLAGLTGQYPFRASRVMVFSAPGALLLLGAGLSPTLMWLRQRMSPPYAIWLARTAIITLCACMLFPVGQAAYRVGWPWPRFDSARAATFVRAHRQPGEAVAGTSWEHEYYFRDQRESFRSFWGPPPVARHVADGRRQNRR